MKKSKVLHFTEVDHAWYESAERCNYGISNNNSLYVPEKDREKSFSVISKSTSKVLITKPNRKECASWIEKKTGKKVVFVSFENFKKY